LHIQSRPATFLGRITNIYMRPFLGLRTRWRRRVTCNRLYAVNAPSASLWDGLGKKWLSKTQFMINWSTLTRTHIYHRSVHHPRLGCWGIELVHIMCLLTLNLL
jgi:hypothetical protein